MAGFTKSYQATKTVNWLGTYRRWLLSGFGPKIDIIAVNPQLRDICHSGHGLSLLLF